MLYQKLVSSSTTLQRRASSLRILVFLLLLSFLASAFIVAAADQPNKYFINKIETTTRIRKDLDIPIKYSVTSEVAVQGDIYIYMYTVVNRGPSTITIAGDKVDNLGRFSQCLGPFLSVMLEPGSKRSFYFRTTTQPLHIKFQKNTSVYVPDSHTWELAIGGIFHLYIPSGLNEGVNCRRTASDEDE